MALSVDALWPRAGNWPAPTGGAVDVALVGIPTWRTSLSGSGAFATPAAIRDALRFYSEFAGDDRPSLSCEQWADAVEPDDDPDGAIAYVARAAAHASLLIALGGDNAATVAAALGTWGDRIGSAGLVTLDAHHDLRDGHSNGSPVRELVEAGLEGSRIVQIGIADFANSAAYARRAADLGITIIRRDVLHRRPMTDVMAEALEIAGSAGGPIHVDLDVDVCDRSVAPACPASLPGGIAAHELRAAARAAGAHRLVESIDITEIDASRDSADARTVRLAALCVLEMTAGMAAR